MCIRDSGKFNQGAFFIASAGAYGDHFGFLGFFLGGVRQEQAAEVISVGTGGRDEKGALIEFTVKPGDLSLIHI